MDEIEFPHHAFDRRDHLTAFLSWLTEGPLTSCVFVEDAQGRLREVYGTNEIAALIQKYEAWEQNEAVRQAEARYD